MTNESASQAVPAVQHESVDVGPILVFVLFVLFGLGLGLWGTVHWFTAEADQARQRHAMAAEYPDLERTRVAARARLNRYALQSDGSYLIPVERAMALLSEEFPVDVPVSAEMEP